MSFFTSYAVNNQFLYIRKLVCWTSMLLFKYFKECIIYMYTVYIKYILVQYVYCIYLILKIQMLYQSKS